MSHWDFGRPADGQQDAARRPGPASTGYPPEPPHGAGDDGWPADEPWPAENGWGAGDGPAREWSPSGGWSPAGPEPAGPKPVGGEWLPAGPESADEGWPEPGLGYPGGDWPPAGPESADEGWSAEDGWVDGEETGPYPLTYERDDYAADATPRAEPAPDRWEPPTAADRPRWRPAAAEGPLDAGADWLAGEAGSQASGPRWNAAARDRWRPGATPDGWASPDPGLSGADDRADWAGPATRRGGRRWPIVGGLAVASAAVGAVAVILSAGHPAAQGAGGTSAGPGPASRGSASPGSASPGSASPGHGATSAAGSAAPSAAAAAPVTMAEAKAALAGYTSVNNNANAQRSGQLLASVESGSSYAIDAGLYQEQQAAGTAPYPAFTPVQATYYIPRDQPASGPRWFAVQVANAFTANPAKVTSSEYLLFTQSAPGGAWQDTAEPYLLAGAGAPQVTVGADGLATAVSAGAATVAVAPGQLAAATAASLDGTGHAVADPGNLADQGDQRFWAGKVPGGQVTDTHAATDGADGPEFALQTADGGALVFYTDAAQLTITPPAGSALRLTIPGFYSPGQSLSRAAVSYLEQFAAYDPPAGGGAPRVVADYSGITGKS